jgi:ornithine--oxo-acid transaminase
VKPAGVGRHGLRRESGVNGLARAIEGGTDGDQRIALSGASIHRLEVVVSPATQSPSSSAAEHIETIEKYGAHNYAPLPVVLSRGEGAFVWDVEGRRFYDMLSAYSAVNQGHCHPRLVKVTQEQAGTLALTSRAYFNDKLGAMVKRLSEVTGFPKILPMNSGAEGVETAIKAMRRWGYRVKGIPTDQARIIVAKDNFHGRTTTIVGFSTDPDAKTDFGPATPGFDIVPYGDIEAIKAKIGPHTAGIMVEPIQGEAGVKVPPAGYLTAIRKLCTEHNVVCCFDEIQTGLGRTGKLFCYCHEGPRPDLLILGKALSGGMYPISALCGIEEVMDVFVPGSHGSTFGGSPMAAAIAVEALNILLDEKLPERAAELGEFAVGRLKAELTHPKLKEVRGKGLLIAVEYTEGIAKNAVKALKDVGVLAKDTHQTTIRFAPPLVISKDDLSAALDLIIPVLNSI